MLETGAQVVADVLSGKRDLRVASGLAPLLNVLLRAIDTTDLERGLAQMKKQLASLWLSPKKVLLATGMQRHRRTRTKPTNQGMMPRLWL